MSRSTMASTRRYDLLVVGSGIAGLYAAIQAQERGATVLLVTKGSIEETSTRYAQGGIAAAIGHDDTPEVHLRDTIEAGAGLVDEEAARILVEGAAERIADLVRYGVQFDATDGAVALTTEAAHSAPRILTSEDLRHLQITLYDSAGDSVVHASFAFDADLDPPPYVNTGTTVLFAGTYRVQSHLRFEDAFRTIATERMTEVTVDRDGAYPLRL